MIGKKFRFLTADYFVILNIAMFSMMSWAVYYDRFIAYRGDENLYEFFIYACAIIVTIIAIWWHWRRLPVSLWLLLIVQIGILMHFAGAFFPIEGGRLYDEHILGLRYDKYVHAFNAFAGAAVVRHLLGPNDIRSTFLPVLVIMIVLGAGSVVEIVEYMVSITVEGNGVGHYDNNMQDLIANLLGVLLFECGRMFAPYQDPKQIKAGDYPVMTDEQSRSAN